MELNAEELLRTLSWLAVVVAVYLALGQWLAYRRRLLVHRERMAAIEKGIDLAPLEGDIRRAISSTRTTLLLAGLTWVGLGAGLFVLLSAVLGDPSNITRGYSLPPQGTQWIGIPVAAIGIAHLVVYWTKRDRQ